MANSALIEDLLKQFAENPRRVFARLANEYRKQGDLDSAIEICRHHVPLQPTYISGYIVLGQALYERGDLEEARTTFETALGLDPENLIALRQLGDIARAGGQLEEATGWYRRLLEVDPQNDEVAALLQELEPHAGERSGGREGAAQAPAPVTWSDINPERAQPEPAAELADPAPALEMLPLPEEVPSLVDGAEASGPAPPGGGAEEVAEPIGLMHFESVVGGGGSEPGEHGGAAPPDTSAAMLEGIDFGEEAPRSARSEEHPAPEPAHSAFATETMAELYLQQGFREKALAIYRQLAEQRPGDQALRERIARLEESTGGDVQPAGRTVRAFFGALAWRRPPAAHAAWAEPAADEEALAGRDEATPSAVVDGYESWQGAEAAAPSDPEPAMREAEDIAPESVGFVEPAAEVSAAPSDAGWPKPAPAAEGGLDELFAGRDVAPADDAAAATLAGAYSEESISGSSGIAGHPARAATDELSLDDVFGAERGDDAARRPAADLSFDDFFARRDGTTPTDGERGGDEPPGSSESPRAGSTGRAGDGSGDASHEQDLELFHAWLDGLKK